MQRAGFDIEPGEKLELKKELGRVALDEAEELGSKQPDFILRCIL